MENWRETKVRGLYEVEFGSVTEEERGAVKLEFGL